MNKRYPSKPIISGGRSMTNLQKLEDLYNREIKVDEAEEKKYRGIVKYLVDNVVIEKLKQTSPDMANLYRETYWGGSFYDGLKVVFIIS